MNIPYGHPAWIEVDLGQFKRNLHLIRELIGSRLLCLPVKANAYGHGLVPIACAAEEAGVDYLAVSCLQEGMLLRQAGIHAPIILFGAIAQEHVADVLAYDLECTVTSFFKAEMLVRECARLAKGCKVHLEIDTGMHRTGVRPDTGARLIRYLMDSDLLELVGIYSHCATADEPNNETAFKQIHAFKEFVDTYRPHKSVICSLANSGGVCYYPESYFDMVRPGLLSYGIYPQRSCAAPANIQPILSLKATISYFKVVPAGSGISYGHTYQTSQESRIVTVPVGYGDGYKRALSNRGSVLIGGNRYPIAGAICMDQFMVDIARGQAYVGDVVTLIGRDGDQEITVTDIAELAHTIPYDILAGFTSRQPRVYTEKGDCVTTSPSKSLTACPL